VEDLVPRDVRREELGERAAGENRDEGTPADVALGREGRRCRGKYRSGDRAVEQAARCLRKPADHRRPADALGVRRGTHATAS
jgi:hypothetical protein